ncbi:thiamine-phosphate kinase [Pseudoxanthomonas sangjuensis]|uniref:thiamine-phosphate kinase n=1 Tax=Pseudoxanthomonas sangjuensis TaxID=1503750 RepID=UPI0013907E01|nr:thiamine-phosphate kinase [Pseudoxanthomonas sangjuensis]KAF1713273.1 thiamine-phosphate kinase [Pseudoxanthomonas sangjuensis]
MSEFELIDRIRARAITRDDIVLGIGDDAAILRPPPSKQLVVTADTLNAGVHFPEATKPGDIGWKSLAVNLSDLAAMGAQPAWCTLSLSLPESDPEWLDGFIDGFLDLAARHDIALVGGDTTRGPLSIAVTAMGLVDNGSAVRRDGAKVGDDIWVTGTLGDAAAALQSLFAGAALDRALRMRLDRPAPRVAAGLRLVGLANSCIDVSDGLLADLGHICERSKVGAEVEISKLPASPSLQRFAPAMRIPWQAGGGDDYELCFTAAPRLRDEIRQALDFAETPGTRIGRIVAGTGVKALDAEGNEWQPPQAGYVHFA